EVEGAGKHPVHLSAVGRIAALLGAIEPGDDLSEPQHLVESIAVECLEPVGGKFTVPAEKGQNTGNQAVAGTDRVAEHLGRVDADVGPAGGGEGHGPFVAERDDHQFAPWPGQKVPRVLLERLAGVERGKILSAELDQVNEIEKTI